MRSSYEVRAQRFIEELFPYLLYCVDCEDYLGAVLDYMVDHPHRNVEFDHGMTRVAFITSDYVVKVDYSDDNVARFGGGEKEIEFYSMAETEGMAYLFAKISRYDYCGQTFYIMPRVKGVGAGGWHDAWDYMTDEETDWCLDHNLYDLHSKNFGLYKGKITIIDYGCHD